MKTIEERANKFALEKHPYSPFCEEYAKMYIEIATEQRDIDMKIIPHLYVRWFMIDGKKPSWHEYVTKAMQE